MHHNNTPTGSGLLWHFLYRLVHKFIRFRSAVSSEKEMAGTKFVVAETGTGRRYYDEFNVREC